MRWRANISVIPTTIIDCVEGSGTVAFALAETATPDPSRRFGRSGGAKPYNPRRQFRASNRSEAWRRYYCFRATRHSRRVDHAVVVVVAGDAGHQADVGDQEVDAVARAVVERRHFEVESEIECFRKVLLEWAKVQSMIVEVSRGSRGCWRRFGFRRLILRARP